jgi:hypothetical protein
MSDFISGMTHGMVNVSEGTLCNFVSQFSDMLVNELDAIREDIMNGEVINVDETPLKCGQTKEYNDGRETVITSKNTTFTATMRNHSNDTATYYTVNPKKDNDGVVRDGILPNFVGTLSHDHDKKYYAYGTAHATCGAHLLRELKGLRDLFMCPWAEGMMALITGMNDKKNNDIQNNIWHCDQETLEAYSTQYDSIVDEGDALLSKMVAGSFGRDELCRMLKRLRNYKSSYMQFMVDYKAPFTNNLSERDLRPGKTKQKNSGCFRSWDGLVDYASNRSFISTLKKRSMDVIGSIVSIFRGILVFAHL